MKCRHCGDLLSHNFIDLGSSPPSNSYLTEKTMLEPEKWYPLKVMVCDKCWLVQTVDVVDSAEMFSHDYAYFSSCSSTWLKHANSYVDKMISRFNLGLDSMVVEIAANDGYLLQYFKGENIPCYGIEPTHSTAITAKAKGLEIIEEFFCTKLANELARKEKYADLIVANNVLAHVPDINDFVKGITLLLNPGGIVTFEFPHLLNLIEQYQFDTIYHEHYSYLSLTAVNNILNTNGLSVFDVEELLTHGGSLRVYAQKSDIEYHPVSNNVDRVLSKEDDTGMKNIGYYQNFRGGAEKIKIDLLEFLINAKKQNKKVVAYGAAAKGNTLLNFSGVKNDLIAYVVDRNPAKQNKYLPGSRIAIVNETHIYNDKPDYVLILPWNLSEEIVEQLQYIYEWNGCFVKAVPEIEIIK